MKNLRKITTIQTYTKTKNTSKKQQFVFNSNLLNQSLEAYEQLYLFQTGFNKHIRFLKTTDYLCFN